MFAFFLTAALMTLFALFALLPVLWRGRGTNNLEVDTQLANLVLSRQELAQLDEQHKAGAVDDQAYTERRKELEFALAQVLSEADDSQVAGGGRWLAVLIAVALPLGAASTYWYLGMPRALDSEWLASTSHTGGSSEQQMVDSVENLLPRLEQHLADNPDDQQGWRLLGVSYLRMQRFPEADRALSRAVELMTDEDPMLLLQLADARAMAGGGRMAGDPETLVQRALAVEPGNVQGLWLAGMAREQDGDNPGAIEFWKQIVPQVQGQPQMLDEIMMLIARAAESEGKTLADFGVDAAAMSAGVASAPVGGDTPADDAAAAMVSVSVTVDLDPALAEEAAAGQAVFVYAKASNGPPMPLAVSRFTVADFPISVTLDDSMAMTPQARLSGFPEVIVGARVSMQGDPIAQPGDLFIESGPVQPVDNPSLALTISQRVQ